MSDISPVNRPSIASLGPNYRASRPDAATPAASPRQADQAEFSTASRLLSRLSELPDVRQDVVDRVRSELDAGTYESNEKIDIALQRLLEDL